MPTIEIAEKKWQQFCRLVDDVCHGGLITIQTGDAEGGRKAIIEDLPLQSIGMDIKSNPCNTAIVIEAGLERPITHVVVEPIHVRLRNDRDERRYNQLEIIAENGTTLVELHPGLSSEELKRLDLGLKTPAREKRMIG